MSIITVKSRIFYNEIVSSGFNPLIDVIRFEMDIKLRVDIQREVFGHSLSSRGDVVAANNRFYHWMWQHKKHICEETMRPLRNYSSAFISHILTRGAHPEMGHDPRNINILFTTAHNQWETGDRKKMRIYPANMRTIELLKKDYSKL